MAMIIITHDLGIVARVSDRVTVMYAGQIVETGDAAEVFHNPIIRILKDCWKVFLCRVRSNLDANWDRFRGLSLL